jgi:ORF6N domain
MPKPQPAEDPLPPAVIEHKIYLLRRQKVMLDSDLAALYGVEAKRLNIAVRRSLEHLLLNGSTELHLSLHPPRSWIHHSSRRPRAAMVRSPTGSGSGELSRISGPFARSTEHCADDIVVWHAAVNRTRGRLRSQPGRC